MATINYSSLLDETTPPPNQFQVSTTTNNNNNNNNHNNNGNNTANSNNSSGSNGQNKAKCKLCLFSRKSFHCTKCIRSGDFLHSSHHYLQQKKMVDKQLEHVRLLTSHYVLKERCLALLETKIIAENIEIQIKQKRERIALIHKLLQEKRENIANLEHRKDMLIKNNKDARKSFPKYERTVDKERDKVEHRRQETVTLYRANEKVGQELMRRVRTDVQALVKYIFPLSETYSKLEMCDTSGQAETVTALAEATRTAYVRGRWVLQDSHSELQHVIVAPSLPGNGDYSAYNDWVVTNQDGVPNSSAGTNNPHTLCSNNNAYRISAALTYTTQMIHILSYYLDVRLPYKQVYGDFCKKELSLQSFNRKVAKLNANILYLCYTQRVPVKTLTPIHTLTNLYQLLDTKISNLGSFGAIKVPYSSIGATETLVLSDLTAEDSESEDENSFPDEWEDISHPLNSIPQQQTGSIVNNAFASVTSLWKGWTAGGR